MAKGSRSSAAGLNPGWVQWLVPSVGDLLFVALLGLLACIFLSVRLLGDGGIGWHIRTGQLILSTHSIPRTDPFSSTMAGQPWFAWEWLYDALVGWLDRAAGLNAVVLFTAVIIAAVFSWTFRLLVARGTNLLVALVLVLLAASASMIHFFARPHVVSWLFTVAWFCILDSSERHPSRRNSRALWALPVLMVVWVNIHGGFLIGLVLLAIYWMSAAWCALTPKRDRFEDVLQKIHAAARARQLALTGILSALATLMNPYGWRLHLHIYRYLSNRFLMDHIDEFQSPNFHLVAQKCFALLLLLSIAVLAARSSGVNRPVRVSELLILLFAVYSGLYASRNIPVSSLLLILTIGPWLSQSVAASPWLDPAANFLPRMQALDATLRGHLWPIAAVALTCWITFHGGKLGASPLMDAHFSPGRFPVAAVDYLQAHNIQSPVLSPDSWGGYLIYRLYPQTKVVLDDRHDLYGEQFLKSYLKMIHAEPGWSDFLQQHPAGYVLVPSDSPLAAILPETPGWQPIYHDDVAVVFVRPPAPRE